LESSDAEEFKRRGEAHGIFPIVVHIPYLINLATPDDRLYRKSIEAYREDIERADLLGADYFITHLGSHTGSGEEKGLQRFSRALDEIIGAVSPKVMILLETTAGAGSWLGSTFEQIRDLMASLKDRRRVGICLDTAHIFEAGYDIRTKEGLEEVLAAFDRVVGTGLIKVVHFNDSRTALGSHADRHEHIGKGEIGLAALGRVIRHPKLHDAAFILETPKKTDKDDVMNLKATRKLFKGRSR
jgi:deoxyribonuclease-4